GLCSDDQAGTLYLYPDLLAVAGIPRVRRIVSKRILPPQLFRDTGKCSVEVIKSVGLKGASTAISCKVFEIILSAGIFTRARAGAAASAAHRYRTAAENYAKDIAPAATPCGRPAIYSAAGRPSIIALRVVADRIYQDVRFLCIFN